MHLLNHCLKIYYYAKKVEIVHFNKIILIIVDYNHKNLFVINQIYHYHN